MIEVETPDGIIEFPADFSQDQINSALNKHFDTIPQTPAAPEAPRDIVGASLPQGPPLPPQAPPDMSTPQALAAWSLNQGISIPSRVAQLYNAGAGAQQQMLAEEAQNAAMAQALKERAATVDTGEGMIGPATPEQLAGGLQYGRQKAGEFMDSMSDVASDFLRRTGIDPSAMPGRNIVDIPSLPITTLPGTNIRPLDLVAPGVGQGIDVGAGKLLSGFTEPGQAAMLPFAGAKPVQALFGAQALAAVPESIQALYQARTPQEFGEAGFGAAANLAMGGLIGRHLLTGKGPYARSVEEAAKVHGNVQPQPGEGAGQVSAQEGLGGVQSQTEGGVAQSPQVPLTITDQGGTLLPQEHSILQAVAAKLGITGAIDVLSKFRDDPDNRTVFRTGFAEVDDKGNYKAPGQIRLSADALRQWMGEAAPGTLHDALGSVLTEEIIHSFTTQAEAEAYGKTLTDAERAISKKFYLGKLTPEEAGGFTDANAGSEAVRQRIQRMLKLDPSEVADVAAKEKWTKASLEMIGRVIRRAREFFGTTAAKEGTGIANRILDRMEQNVNSASEAIGEEAPFGQQSALRRGKGEEDQSEAAKTFLTQLQDRSVSVRNQQTAKAGMGLETIADLDAMLAALKRERATEQQNLADAQRTGDTSKLGRGRGQLPREVIETATKLGSWETDFPELGVRGERPLQWDKNPEVADWVRQHASEIWTNPEAIRELPDALKPEEGQAALRRVAVDVDKMSQSEDEYDRAAAGKWNLLPPDLQQKVIALNDYEAEHEKRVGRFEQGRGSDYKQFGAKAAVARRENAIAKEIDQYAPGFTLTARAIAAGNGRFERYLRSPEEGQAALNRTPARSTDFQEPPVPEGMTRLYRGFDGGPNKLPDYINKVTRPKEAFKRWFTPNRNYALSYAWKPMEGAYGEYFPEGAKLHYVDVPKGTDLGQFAVPDHAGEFILPKELSEQAADATRVTEQQAAIRRTKAKEEGQPEEVTPVNVTRAAYQHLDQSAQDVMVDPSAKQISYDRFAKDLKARFPGITSNALADTFEGSTWNMLMNASGEKLAALRESLNLRKSLGDRDVSNPPVRETGPPPVGKTGEERARLRDIRKAQVAGQKYRANVISNIARKLFEGMEYDPTQIRTEVTPFDLWKPRNRQGILKPEPDQPVYNELTPEDRALPTDALGRMLTKDARASAKQKVSRTNRVTVLQNNDTHKVEAVSTFRDPRRGAVLLDPQHPGQEHAPLESILKRYTPVASILLDRPVEKFRQSYDSLADYEFKFGREARAAAHEPMAEAPEAQGLPSAYQPTDPITRSEADAIIPHIENEVGTIDSPEAVKAALDALPERLAQRTKALKRGYKSGAIPEPEAEGAGTRQAVSAYLKITNKLQEQFPDATAQEILERLATKIYEIHNAAPAYEDFLRNIMAEGHPEVGQAAPNRPVTAPVPASEKGQAALRRKNEPGEEVAKAISEGPGAASPGDVPPAPPLTAPVASLPPGERPYQLVTPSSPTFAAVGQALLEGGSRMAGGLRAIIKGAAGDSMPKTTRANQAAGEAGVRYAASKGFARHGAAVFSAQTLQGTGVDPVSFGAALVEDNLRSVREGFRAEVTRLTAEGKPREAATAQAQANAVTSLVGANHSPFADENAYQDFLADPNTRRAIEQHKQQWEEVVDPMYRDAQAIDPDAPLPSRGQQTGARVNLKAILPGDEPVNMVGPKPRGPSLTATFKRKSPFARQAKGTGQAYEVNYNELIANTFERQLEIANKNAFDKSLVESGNAVIDKPGRQVMVGDERGVAFPLQRRVIAGTGQQPFSQAQNIYVRQSLATEYRIASDVDAPFKIPALTSMMNVLNKAALAGLTDFTIHFSNQLTALFNRPASAGLLTDSLLSATGRADVPITLGRAVLKAMQNNEGQLAELAKIGALRDPFAKVNPLGRILGKTDEISRLLLDDTYKRLADAGLVERSETARREYVNQIGQYNRRLQGSLTRFLRDTGFGPFVTAGKTFNALGVRMVTLSPGAKSTGAFAETALRGNVLSKWVGAAVLLGSLNYLLTNKQKGGGMMGRPGVPIGSLDTGKDDKQGRPLSIPLLDILGLGRGLRVTGVKGYAQAKYLGLTNGTALDASARDIINSTFGPAAGPPVRFAGVTATGGPPAVNVPRTAPVAAPGQNQFVLNLQEALKDANPLIKSYVDWRNGKTVGEAVGQQVPRFAMQPGKAPALAAKYPQIVNAAQLRAYTDDLAKQLRSMPIKDRYQSTFKKFKADALSPQNRAQAFDQLERHGVFEYQ